VREWLRGRGQPLGEPFPLGRFGRTWVVPVGQGRLVIKRLGAERAAPEYARLFRHVADLGIAPRFVGSISSPADWYAVFEFVPGRQLRTGDPEWELVWAQVPETLQRLCSSTVVPAFDVLDHWRAVLSGHHFPAGPGRQLQEALFANEPEGQRVVLVHGDFSPQNFILAGRKLMLVDWEQAGGAPAGFDAGWAIAIVTAGAATGIDTAPIVAALRRAGPDEGVLGWFVRLGLLRMLWRAHTLPLTDVVRVALLAQLRQTIARELEIGITG
jgi:hypothetical protein